jgi:hypothetical protein
LVLLMGVVMKYTVEVTSDGKIYAPSLSLCIQIILRLLPRQSERLQCCYWIYDYAAEITFDGMTYHGDRLVNNTSKV